MIEKSWDLFNFPYIFVVGILKSMTDLQLERFLVNKPSWGFSHKGNIIIDILHHWSKTQLPQVKLTISFGIAALLFLVLILKPLQRPTAFIDWSPIDDVNVSGMTLLAHMKRCKYINAQKPGNWILIFCIIIQKQILLFFTFVYFTVLHECLMISQDYLSLTFVMLKGSCTVVVRKKFIIYMYAIILAYLIIHNQN